jgi:hypothetical protein
VTWQVLSAYVLQGDRALSSYTHLTAFTSNGYQLLCISVVPFAAIDARLLYAAPSHLMLQVYAAPSHFDVYYQLLCISVLPSAAADAQLVYAAPSHLICIYQLSAPW